MRTKELSDLKTDCWNTSGQALGSDNAGFHYVILTIHFEAKDLMSKSSHVVLGMIVLHP